MSESTVSNVLNNPEVVAAVTRQRVLDAMAQVGYVRNGVARQLRGGRSIIVGCILLDAANPFFAQVARGIEDRLAEANCMLMVCSTDAWVDRQAHYVRAMEELGVRGVLVNPLTADLAPLLQLSQRGTPVVLLDHPRAGVDLCAVAVDDVHGGELAGRHIASLGHRRVALLGGSTDVRSLHERTAGMRRGLGAAGVAGPAVREFRVPQPCTIDQADEAIGEVLAASPRPTAVICFNDIVATGALRGLARRGVDVPGQVSVIGYDDVAFAAQLAPALTTIRQPKQQLGRAAADLLLAEEQPGHRHREIRFAPELVVRGSTGPPGR